MTTHNPHVINRMQRGHWLCKLLQVKGNIKWQTLSQQRKGF